jgi:hypothetical protein
VEIKDIVSQMEKKMQLALEADNPVDKEIYMQSIKGLQEREKALREKEVILLRATPVTKEPRAGTFHLHLLRPFWVIVRVSVSPTRIRLNTSP